MLFCDFEIILTQSKDLLKVFFLTVKWFTTKKFSWHNVWTQEGFHQTLAKLVDQCPSHGRLLFAAPVITWNNLSLHVNIELIKSVNKNLSNLLHFDSIPPYPANKSFWNFHFCKINRINLIIVIKMNFWKIHCKVKYILVKNNEGNFPLLANIS